MKASVVILALTLAGTGLLSAQDYSAGKKGEYSKKIEVKPETPAQTQERLKPVPSGVIYEMSEKGLVIIWPGAPAEYGVGEKFLTSNPFPANQTGTDQKGSRDREFGGIKLIGFDF